MADLSHQIGSDLAVGATGDLATVTLADATQQRLLRRLMTNAGEYIWQLDYGAGLPALVGEPLSAESIAALVRSQIGLEAGVASQPEPTITVSSDNAGTVLCRIAYTDAVTGEAQILSLGDA